jgi:hypothetical protein
LGACASSVISLTFIGFSRWIGKRFKIPNFGYTQRYTLF